MKFKVGFGYDVHTLVDGESFRIGGIDIPHNKKPHGHSDADALIHAICDALLGAAGMRDIGYHFPDTDPKFHQIDSTILLKEVNQLLKNSGFSIGNIDATIVLEKPKISPYVEDIQKTLGKILELEMEDIGIKATTNEKVGFVGREEGVAVYAIALIYKS